MQGGAVAKPDAKARACAFMPRWVDGGILLFYCAAGMAIVEADPPVLLQTQQMQQCSVVRTNLERPVSVQVFPIRLKVPLGLSFKAAWSVQLFMC